MTTIAKSRLAHVRVCMIFLREGHSPRADYGQADGTLAALITSIQEKGILSPPILRAADPARQRYYIVAGHRRVAAAKHLKMAELICTCLDWKPEAEAAMEDLLLSMVENLQRKDLNPIERAEAFARLISQGARQIEIAQSVGVTQTYISQSLALLKLPPSVRESMRAGDISKSAGEELIPLTKSGVPAASIERVAAQAIREKQTSRHLRDVVRKQVNPSSIAPASAPASSRAPILQDGLTEEQLTRWATKKFGSVAKALAELKRRIEESA